MKKSLRVCLIQNNAGPEWQFNLKSLRPMLFKAIRKKPDLILLPENFIARTSSDDLSRLAHEVTPMALDFFKRLAKTYRITFLLGSLIEKSNNRKKFYNTSFVISPNGRISAKYRKIHLFDIQLKGKVKVQESRYIRAGEKVVCAKIKNIPLGLSVCYDLRFPELYRKLSKMGARILCVPSNFTRPTGQAHWEVLLRARAIENQAFVLAPGQVGLSPSAKVPSFGNSLVIDPWGSVLAKGSSAQEQVITADLDLSSQLSLRRQFPVLSHRRLKIPA